MRNPDGLETDGQQSTELMLRSPSELVIERHSISGEEESVTVKDLADEIHGHLRSSEEVSRSPVSPKALRVGLDMVACQMV